MPMVLVSKVTKAVRARSRGAGSWAGVAGRAAVVWLALLALAFVNGALRELIFISALAYPETVAQQLSALTGILLFTACVWHLWPWMRPRTLAISALVGLAWLLATALTETLLINMWLNGMEWAEVAGEYDMAQGKLWPLVLTWVALLPIMVHSTYPGL